MTSTQNNVLIVGSMAFDDLELPTTSAKNVVGGAATYASLAAAPLAPSRVVAVVGEDFAAREIDALANRKIDTAGIERAKGKTFHWSGRYDSKLLSRTTLDTQLNVFANFRPKLPKHYKTSELVLLANIHPALQLEVLDQIDGPRMVFADTMNFWIDGQAELLGKVLERVDVLTINDEEARLLSGVYSLPKAAKLILERGPKSLIIKRGEAGSMLFDKQGIFSLPAIPLDDVVDPTGAGDSFAGAMVGYLAYSDDLTPMGLRRAMMAGTAVASYCVQAVGTARLARLSREEIASRVRALQELLNYGEALRLD